MMRGSGLVGLLLATVLTLAACGGSGGSGGGNGGDDMRGMEGMDHGSMSDEEVARMMVAPNGEYSDAAFVDSMIPHHEGAVEMAQVALQNAEHEDIRTLAQDIVDSQRAEIELLGQMREELGGPTTMSMSQEEVEGMMGIYMDPQALAQEKPFDRAFMDAMTPHHESAIAMANVALEESQDPEIRRIAEDIVSAQEREISQMRQWREEWYPKA